MDTLYIKMADCPEIQELRPRSKYPYYEDGDMLFAHWPDGTSYPVEKRERRIHIYTVLSNDPTKYSKPIWLPRQDDLQKMVKETASLLSDGECAYRFGQWCFPQFPQITDTSMEQLWLAFVMKEKYNKTWNGEHWI